MLPLVRDQLPNLAELCQRYQVRTLAIFGSALRDDFDLRRSDLDFLVEFDEPPPGNYAKAYFGLLFALEELFGRSVDLLTIPSLKNPYLRRQIFQERQLLFQAP